MGREKVNVRLTKSPATEGLGEEEDIVITMGVTAEAGPASGMLTVWAITASAATTVQKRAFLTD
jgi:hypothetical protein